MIRRLALFFLCLLLSAPAHAQMPPEHVVHASLVAEQDSIIEGRPFWLGVRLETPPDWHTYWENPGDAGLATSLNWILPEGFTAGTIDWPAPKRLSEGPLTTYSYQGSVFLPVLITPPATLDSSESYTFKVHAEWLVCKEICLPETAEMMITLPAADHASPSAFASAFAVHRQQKPVTLQMPLNYQLNDKTLTLMLPVHDHVKAASFFPRQGNLVRNDTQRFATESNLLQLSVPRMDNAEGVPGSGIVSVETAQGAKHYEVTLASTPQAGTNNGTPAFAAILLFAMLGGLILNLMPCVLPVLSLKALAIVKKSGAEHTAVVRQGVAYTLGVLVSFTTVAGILIGLQQGGEAVGWGYQMQSPVFVGCLAYLLFLVGLNLSGVFELPVLWGNVGSDVTNEASVRGSFFTGVLATAVATPCTAPFMASAVGVALTLAPLQALLVFEALGFGLALPFLLISLFPALRGFLPKPGAWMNSFRQFLAFPMYASVIWLLWVLTLQTGASGMAVALSGMLAIITIIWMKPLFSDATHYHRGAAVAYVLMFAVTLPMLAKLDPTAHVKMMEKMAIEEVPYTPQALQKLRDEGKAVFVDATAAWCITCQVNARVAIHTERTMQAFHDHGITLMVADWTRRNDDITAFLSGFGYKGVPLYVFYPAKGEPKVLPQLLTEDSVIEAIKEHP